MKKMIEKYMKNTKKWIHNILIKKMDDKYLQEKFGNEKKIQKKYIQVKNMNKKLFLQNNLWGEKI